MLKFIYGLILKARVTKCISENQALKLSLQNIKKFPHMFLQNKLNLNNNNNHNIRHINDHYILHDCF